MSEEQAKIQQLERLVNDMAEVISTAYGALWKFDGLDVRVRDARLTLLSVMTRRDQEAGIRAAIKKYGAFSNPQEEGLSR